MCLQDKCTSGSPLCSFWFHSFIRKYLSSWQQIKRGTYVSHPLCHGYIQELERSAFWVRRPQSHFPAISKELCNRHYQRHRQKPQLGKHRKRYSTVSWMSIQPLVSDAPEWPPLWRQRLQDWGTEISESEQLSIGTIQMNEQDKTAYLIHSLGEFGREWIHVNAWLSPFAIHLNYHNIVNQLYTQYKIKSF